MEEPMKPENVVSGSVMSFDLLPEEKPVVESTTAGSVVSMDFVPEKKPEEAKPRPENEMSGNVMSFDFVPEEKPKPKAEPLKTQFPPKKPDPPKKELPYDPNRPANVVDEGSTNVGKLAAMFEQKNKKVQEEKMKKPIRPKNPIVEKQKEEAKNAPPKPMAAPK